MLHLLRFLPVIERTADFIKAFYNLIQTFPYTFIAETFSLNIPADFFLSLIHI